MASGIQVFNADGTLQFDSNDRLLRSLTVVASGLDDGSVTVSGATSQGTVVATNLNNPENQVTPKVAVSGNTVSWTFEGAPSDARAASDIAILAY